MAAQLQQRWVAVRDFDAARALVAADPRLDAIPVLQIESTLPKPWRITIADDDVLKLASYTPKADYSIIAIGHPSCHFSRNAAAAIEADPSLRKAFAGHAIWLAPQDGRLQAALFSAWNRQHPLAAMSLVWQQSEWPLVDDWGTPTFYFVRDGRLIGKVTGWPKEGRVAELKAAIGASAKR